MDLIAFRYSAGGARSMPTYDDGTTPTLVTEKQPAVMLKVRGGADTYMKPDGSIGTAGKGALTSEERQLDTESRRRPDIHRACTATNIQPIVLDRTDTWT